MLGAMDVSLGPLHPTGATRYRRSVAPPGAIISPVVYLVVCGYQGNAGVLGQCSGVEGTLSSGEIVPPHFLCVGGTWRGSCSRRRAPSGFEFFR